MPRLLRTVLWNRADRRGAEYFGLWAHEHGWELRGTVVIALGGNPMRIRYGVICDEQWRTRALHVGLRANASEQALHLQVDAEHHWSTRTGELTDLRGCLDVDLSITPATSTPPIRRLCLGVGETRAISAAVVSFPELTLEARQQRYERVEERFYRCVSAERSCELEVDDWGLIVRHGNTWHRVGFQDGISVDDYYFSDT